MTINLPDDLRDTVVTALNERKADLESRLYSLNQDGWKARFTINREGRTQWLDTLREELDRIERVKVLLGAPEEK